MAIPQLLKEKNRSRWGAILLAVLILFTCLFFTFASVLMVPSPGFSLNRAWVIVHVEPCRERDQWCKVNEGKLQVGDKLRSIGELTWEDFLADRSRSTFSGYKPGDSVSVTFERNGGVDSIRWRIPQFDYAELFERAITTFVVVGPFWIVGTVILLFMQPRNNRWLIMIIFNYVTALWLSTGLYSNTQVAYSPLIVRSLSWVLVAIYIHLHLIVPSTIFRRFASIFLPILYASMFVLGIMELAQQLPFDAYLLALLAAALGSAILLAIRLIRPTSTANQIAARLMLLGVIFAFGPAIVLWILPWLFGAASTGELGISASLLAVPALPLFYGYAIYKRNLGFQESRINRLLSHYAVFLLFVTFFTLAFVLGIGFNGVGTTSLGFLILISGLAVLAAWPLAAHIQHTANRLSYGNDYDAELLLKELSTKIQLSLNEDELVRTLVDEIIAVLRVERSALLLAEGGELVPVHLQNVTEEEIFRDFGRETNLLAYAGRYLPPSEAEGGNAEPAWVRLIIGLVTQHRDVGLWMFGNRVPDDFYSTNDIQLLQNLANLAAVTIENRRLISDIKHQLEVRKQAERQLEQLSEKLLRLQEEERKRISYTLHDEVGQVLTAILLNLASVEQSIPDSAEGQILDLLDDTENLVDIVIDQVRTLSHDLRPAMLHDLGLVPTLRWYIGSYQKRHQIDVSLETEHLESRLSDSVETTVYRIVQEALTNIARHASATQVEIYIRREDGVVKTSIHDNGRGFDVKEVETRPTTEQGIGLAAIRERTLLLGGNMLVQSSIDGGTLLSVEIPDSEVKSSRTLV